MLEQQQPEPQPGQPAGQNPVPEPGNQPAQQGQEGGQNAGQQPPPQPVPIQPPPQPGPPVMMQEAATPAQSPGDFRDIYSAGAQSVIEAFRAQREAEDAVAMAEAALQDVRVDVLDAENVLANRQQKAAEARAKTMKCVKAQAKLLENYLNEESGT